MGISIPRCIGGNNDIALLIRSVQPGSFHVGNFPIFLHDELDVYRTLHSPFLSYRRIADIPADVLHQGFVPSNELGRLFGCDEHLMGRVIICRSLRLNLYHTVGSPFAPDGFACRSFQHGDVSNIFGIDADGIGQISICHII